MPTSREFNVRHGLRVGTKSVVNGSGIVTDIGDISLLNTTDKTSIVDAVNEVEGNLASITTADVAEDPGYLYYTDARARDSVSVTDTGGDGSLSYDSASGIFTYTGPSASEVRAHFTGGTGVTITDGVVAIGQAVGTADNVSFANLTLTGVLYGPSQFVIDPAAQGDITGEVIILGDLRVEGTTTTINSTTVEVEDKTILLAKSATVPTDADGSGIEVAGAGASLLYEFTTDSWNPNKTLKGVDGDASSPAYSFTTDPGLGLYRSADNQVSLATNGSERLRISDTTATLVGSVDLVLNRGTYGGTITTASLTANRTYTLPNVSGTLATTADLSQFAPTTSAQLAGIISDETGTGALVFAISPTLTTPVIGAATGTSLSLTGGGLTARPASNQDAMVVSGRAGGTGSFAVTITPTTLTASRTLTAPDTSGTIVTTGDTGTVTSAMIVNGTIVDADISSVAAIADTKLDTISTAGKVSNSATTATDANTASAIVARNASGNFSAGTITADLTGNAATATKLDSSRTFEVTGDVTGTVSSDLTSGASIATSIASGVIVDDDINANAEIAVSKLANGAARQLLQTDAAGTGVEWTDDIDVPGTLDVTGAAVFDSRVSINGVDITESARDVEESRLIRLNATISVGVAGTVPFGVGPVIPPGMSLVGIGPDSYNVIDIYSGSIC